MEGTIDSYIKERVRKMGFSKYSFKPVKFRVNRSVLELKAFNEFYLLFHCSSETDVFRIKADNDIITNEDYFSIGIPYLLYELRGNISIDTLIGNSDITFLMYHVMLER